MQASITVCIAQKTVHKRLESRLTSSANFSNETRLVFEARLLFKAQLVFKDFITVGYIHRLTVEMSIVAV